MPNTYKKLARVEVTGSQSEIDFSSFSGYTDLVIHVSARNSSTTGSTWRPLAMRFNGSTTSYADLTLASDGSTAFAFANGIGTSRAFVGDLAMNDNTANSFGYSEIYIPNYADSTVNKTFFVSSVLGTNAVPSQQDLISGTWSNTSAITSIKLLWENGALFVIGSTATLYGIKRD